MKGIERDQPIITLTNPVPTEGGKFNGKVTYDVYTKSGAPSSSLGAIDGDLKEKGFTKVFTEDPRFYPKYGVSTPEDIRRIFGSDIVGISATNRNADSSLDFTHQYKEQNPNGIVIAGGFGPSMETEKWLEGGVDIVVRGEGDVTTPLVVKALKNGESLENIKGISYMVDGEIRNNEDRPLLTEKELSELPIPSYPDYIRKTRKVHVVNESRGCYGKCKFCCVVVAYNGTYRMKTPERVAAEIADGKAGETVFFTGDNLVPKQRRTDSRRLAETLIEKGLTGLKLAQVDASFAQDLDLVRLWKKAGLFWVFQGKESINPEALKNVSKAFTAEQSINSTEILRKEGLGVHDMFVLGIDGDTLKTMEELRRYLRKRNKANTGQFFPLTPLAGTQVGREKEILGFAKNESNLFDGQHLTTYPPADSGFTCLELQDAIVDRYLDFFNTGHLLSTVLRDAKQIFTDPQRAKRLIALDIMSHFYAKDTVKSMKKDPYYQEFRRNLQKADDEIARKKFSVDTDVKKENPELPAKVTIFDSNSDSLKKINS